MSSLQFFLLIFCLLILKFCFLSSSGLLRPLGRSDLDGQVFECAQNRFIYFWPLGPFHLAGFLLFPFSQPGFSLAFLSLFFESEGPKLVVAPSSAQVSKCQGGLPCTMHALLTPSLRLCFLTPSRQSCPTRLGILTWSWPQSLLHPKMGFTELHRALLPLLHLAVCN